MSGLAGVPMVVMVREHGPGSTPVRYSVQGSATAPNAQGRHLTIFWQCELYFSDSQRKAAKKIRAAAVSAFAKLDPPISITAEDNDSLIFGGPT